MINPPQFAADSRFADDLVTFFRLRSFRICALLIVSAVGFFSRISNDNFSNRLVHLENRSQRCNWHRAYSLIRTASFVSHIYHLLTQACLCEGPARQDFSHHVLYPSFPIHSQATVS